MALEEALTRAFETLTERLRGEVDQEVVRRMAASSSASAEAAANEPASVGAASERDGAAARLAAGIGRIDAARSLAGVLDALLDGARAESADAAIWLRRGRQLHRWRADGASDGTPGVSDGISLTLAGGIIGIITSELRTQNLELLIRYASRCLEALTAFATARALTRRPEADAAPGPAAGADAEEDASARRYARLLVSEIKLYHEAAVIDGRRDRDLATRLGGEIAHARVMYEQRVPPQVRVRVDYFHDELVRTLCNGDAGLMEVQTENVQVRTEK